MKNTKTRQTTAGTAANSSSQGARFATLKKQRDSGAITWGDAEDSLLSSVIESVVEAGCLISFGRTSDGGAIVLSIVDDGEPTRFYMSAREELEQTLRDVYELAATL